MVLPGPQLCYSLEAEQAALGAMLISRIAVETCCELLTVNAFYHAAHQKIFAAIETLARQGEPVDVLTVPETLKARGLLESIGGIPYINTLAETVPTAAHVRYYAETVAHLSLRREYRAAAETIELLADDLGWPIEDVAEKAEQLVLEVAQTRSESEIRTASEMATSATERLMAPVVPGIRIGFRLLDWMLNGMQPQRLYLIGGRPAMGKTAFLVNVIDHLLRTGHRPFLISLEMGETDIWNRLRALRTGLSVGAIETQQITSDERCRLLEADMDLNGAGLTMADRPGRSLAQLQRVIRRAKSRHSADVVLVDYLQLVRPDSGRPEDVGHFTRVANGLKDAARENDLPVIALSQLSREVDKRTPPRPILTDLRESGGIEQAADVVALLYRAAYYEHMKTGEDVPGPHDVELIVAKNRHGKTGTVPILWHPELMRFTDIDRHHADAPPAYAEKGFCYDS